MFNLTQRWRFPSNNYGATLGISESGVEMFNGTPIKSLAREICQNSLDACLDAGKPTRVEFKTFEVIPQEIPGHEALVDACRRAHAYWEVQSDKKAQKFFQKALHTLCAERIACLRISDFNTTGLRGSRAEYNSPWCNLTKSSGVSDKSGGSGGSFGIGKFAPYACSALRTVFYSTYDSDGFSASQGVARLTSFRNEAGETTQGAGFYGNEKNTPATGQFSLERGYARRRGDCGTDIFILGFMQDDEWYEKMTASILDDFLYAVHMEKLVVDVDGVQISRETLPARMETYREKQKKKDKGYAYGYYRTVVDEKARTFTKDLTEDGITGTLTLRLLLEGGSGKVAMIRQTGMKIEDKARFSNVLPLAGTMVIEGASVNEYLRSIENPQHVKWERDRAENKSKADRLLRSFRRFILDALNAMMSSENEESIDPDVGEYLSIGEGETRNQRRAERLPGGIKDVKTSVIDAMPQPAEMQGGLFAEGSIDDPESAQESLDFSGEEDDAVDSGGGGHGGGADAGGDAAPAPHGKKLARIAVDRVRFIVRNKAAGAYRLVFTPAVSAVDGVAEIYISAESQTYKAAIVDVSSADCPGVQVSHNRVTGLVFTKDVPLRLDIRLGYRDYCALEVKVYGNQT